MQRVVGTKGADVIKTASGVAVNADGKAGNDRIVGSDLIDVINGGADDDLIRGNDGDDEIKGGTGNDRVFGDRGADVLRGGVGNDFLSGGEGDDWVSGGRDNDVVLGGRGNDMLYGNSGDDLIYGNSGNDRTFGGTGNDRMFGGKGDDWVHGGRGDDVLYGNSGNDWLLGGSGNDLLVGGSGDDALWGGSGRDTVRAGSGNDYVYVSSAAVELSGGSGYDTLDFGGVAGGVKLDLGKKTVTIAGETGSISGFETIDGSAAADVMMGDRNATVFRLGDGDDVVRSRLGADDLVGGGGRDTFVFGVKDIADGSRDTIWDFTVGEDRLDVSEFVSGGRTLEQSVRTVATNEGTMVQGYTNGDWQDIAHLMYVPQAAVSDVSILV
jgi:Ca2+-binding RTX toxin-like protein